jgi:hypothetical protein
MSWWVFLCPTTACLLQAEHLPSIALTAGPNGHSFQFLNLTEECEYSTRGNLSGFSLELLKMYGFSFWIISRRCQQVHSDGSNSRTINEWRVGRCLEVSGCGPFTTPEFASNDWGKPRKTPFSIDSTRPRIEQTPSRMNLESYLPQRQPIRFLTAWRLCLQGSDVLHIVQ